MRKVLIVFMVFLVLGCAKKYVKEGAEQPTREGVVAEKPALPEKAEKETVKEDIYASREGKPGEGAIGEKEGKITTKDIFKDIYFDFDKYDIRPDALPVLNEIAEWLKKNKANIVIEGHCDERGTNEYNLALGEKRAKAARDYLVTLGIPSSRINTLTYGEERPQCTEHNEDCWQLNRRAHFVVVE
ncbi:MAG: peptidoglycan-associated lipoprotein Pal [Thermodesulfovibrionia bacterium]